MISFTDDAYRQYFYRHWDWMAETGSAIKLCNENIAALRACRMSLDKNLKVASRNDCFACGAAKMTFDDDDCDNCPVYPSRDTKCLSGKSEYNLWKSAKSKKTRQKYARQIAQLPWRGKSRKEWEKEDGKL